MATIKKHIPSFFSNFELETIEFNTQEELLEIPFVKGFSVKNINDKDLRMDPYFYRYSIYNNKLMVEVDSGRASFVVGYIDDVSNLNLPKWNPNNEY